MAENSENSLLPPHGPVPAAPGAGRLGAPGGLGLLAAVLIVAGSAVLGVAGGLVWAAVAPRVVYQVATLHPPTAYAVNAETSAFIAADGAYCFIAVGGGVLIGIVGYLFVRRYGPVPMAGVVVGATAAAFLADWIGHWATGGPTFDGLLAGSKPGELLRAPITLGAHGAIAFWPLAAAAVVGATELIGVLRDRQREAG